MKSEMQLTKGERTHGKILAAAKDLFLSQGYTATSMRQIAGTVGITPAAIYTHFSGKEEIFTMLLEKVSPIPSILAVFETIEADAPEFCIESTFRQMVTLFSQHEDYIQLALIDAQERDGASLGSFLPKLLPSGLSYYRRILDLEPCEYQLRDISPFLFMRALVSLIGGYILSERVIGSVVTTQLPQTDWVKGLADIFLHGVLKPRRKGA